MSNSRRRRLGYNSRQMNVLHRIRRCSGTLSRVNLALFVLVWLSVVVAPCAMAMQAGVMAPEHDCPHCPPRPCHETAPQECDAPDSLDSLRIGEKAQEIALLPPRTFEPVLFVATSRVDTTPVYMPPVRAGPRPHLVHAQFNE